MKKLSLFISLIILFNTIYSFSQTRGVSLPGRITSRAETAITQKKLDDISCTLSFIEPSGDKILGEGETGQLTVYVNNNNQKATINPKLEIIYKPSWMTTSKSMVKWMTSIGPGKSGTFQTTLKWDKRLPAGSIDYQVKVTDQNSGLSSSSDHLAIQIQGAKVAPAQPAAPIFVDIDKAIPRTFQNNTHAIAVVIGNKDYTNNDVPDVDYAINDAQIVKQYLMSMLGYKEANIIYLENAGKLAFEQTFGTSEYYQGKLYNYVRPNLSDVFIYYSGHGAPDLQNQKAYFMPVNCDPNYVRISGYSLDLFYQNLAKIPAKSMNVVLDACFSGGSQSGMLIKKASPMYIDVKMPLLASNKVNLITSASGSQISSWLPEGNHSLFTYYYLRGLRGEADGDKNRLVTLREMKQYLDNNVPYTARRKYAREQTPVVKGNMSSVLIKY